MSAVVLWMSPTALRMSIPILTVGGSVRGDHKMGSMGGLTVFVAGILWNGCEE